MFKLVGMQYKVALIIDDNNNKIIFNFIINNEGDILVKNKKIVSYTLAATLATSIVPNADSEVVSATENNSVENNAVENLKENL